MESHGHFLRKKNLGYMKTGTGNWYLFWFCCYVNSTDFKGEELSWGWYFERELEKKLEYSYFMITYFVRLANVYNQGMSLVLPPFYGGTNEKKLLPEPEQLPALEQKGLKWERKLLSHISILLDKMWLSTSSILRRCLSYPLVTIFSELLLLSLYKV